MSAALMTLCRKHWERISCDYETEPVPGSEGKGRCQMCGKNDGSTVQYECHSKADIAFRHALARRNAKIGLSNQNDRRARAREPFRDW